MSRISLNKPDSLFVFSPGGENADNYFFYHTGCAFIISFLRQAGFNAEQFICNESVNLENCVRKILKHKARVVGFTVYNTNFITSVLIAEKVKKLSPGTLIVFGGPASTNYSDFIIGRYPYIDACFRNSGEETFLQFLVQLTCHNFDLSRIDPGQLNGVIYRDGKNIYDIPWNTIPAPDSGSPGYLDKYPSPYLSGVIPGPAAFNIGLLTARGCNQNCIYCNCAVLSERRFFTHSVDRIISEIDFISAFSANQILNIFDDAFSLIPRRAKSICRAIIDNRIRIQLSCTTRCDCVDEELLELMKEAGFVSVGFSLESANPKTLRVIGKVHKAEDYPSDDMEKEIMFIERLGKVSSYAKKIGIRNVFSSIISGLPFETTEEANHTVETIGKYADIDFYSHNFLTIYHGTPLFSTYPRYGYRMELIDNNPVFSRTIYPDEIIKKVKVLSKSQIQKAHNINTRNTLKILSLVPEKKSPGKWVNNIILLSDSVEKEFIGWLKKILAINGKIIQIYSDKDAVSGYSKTNYEKYIKYSSPSLKIQNYYIERKGKLMSLISYDTSFLNMEERADNIVVCDFEFVLANLNNPDIDFLNILCKESAAGDATMAWEYFCKTSKQKNLFSFLINRRTYPFFASLCKWTASHANCTRMDTFIINERSEVRLCWYGSKAGVVGQGFRELMSNIESFRKEKSDERSCGSCPAKDYCIKCASPFPLSDNDYCNNQKRKNITETAEMFVFFDVFKQYM